MFREGSGSAGWLAAMVLAVLVSAAASGAQELRTVLRTGDDVPRFGRIGIWGLHLAGIDDRGRALVSHFGQQAETGYWADGERIVPLLNPQQTAVDGLYGTTLSVQAGGVVVGFGDDIPGPGMRHTLFTVVAGEANAVAHQGDRDADGNMICEIHRGVVNAAGTVAFAAHIRIAPGTCSDYDESGAQYSEAIYLADGGDLRPVAGTGPQSPPSWELRQVGLYAINDAGEAIVHATTWEHDAGETFTQVDYVLAVGRDALRAVYRFGGSDGPGQIATGTDPGWFQVLAVNADGQVVVRRRDDVLALYRSAAGQLVRLIATGAPTAWGEGVYTEQDTYGWPASFAANGDVLLSTVDGKRLLLLPAEGTPRVFDDSNNGYLNARRDVAALRRIGDNAAEIVRHRNGGVRRLAATGDRLPGGNILASGGLGAACMAPNGAIAVSVMNTESETALACSDARGVRVVSRMGDPRPDRRRFYSFDACAFAGSEELIFIGSGLVPRGRPRNYVVQRAVYRATAQRLERVFGPGDVLDDGSTIAGMLSGWDALLDADASGRVMALVRTSAGVALALADADGTLRRMPLRVRNYNVFDDEITFEADSTIDHEYLAGVAARPTGGSGRAALRGMPAGEPIDEDAVWIHSGGLAASGGIFLLGSRQRPHPDGDWRERRVILLVDADGADTVYEEDESSSYIDSLRVGGDRIAFVDRSEGAVIYAYARGDAAPVAIVATGDRSPAGLVGFPYPLGISPDGDVFFLDIPQETQQAQLFAARDGVLRVLGPIGSVSENANAVSDSAALMVSNQGEVLVAGSAPNTASCPLPPVLPPPPPEPTPTARPDTGPFPPDLPFEPQQCRPGACVGIDSITARAGAVVTVSVWMDGGGTPVVATENELNFPPIARIESCEANPEINKTGSAFRIGETNSKAIIISLTDVEQIPDGSVLYTCEVHIADAAAAGHYHLACAYPGAADPDGNEVSMSCNDGVLTIEDENTGESPQLTDSSSGGGCAVQTDAQGSAWILLLAAVPMLVTRRMSVARRH